MEKIETLNDAMAVINNCDDPVAAIQQIENCETVEISIDGVWIEGPQRGHWLGDDETIELAEKLMKL